MKVVNDFTDYELLDTSKGEKLEKWGDYILRRPDPQVIWEKETINIWNKPDAIYERKSTGGGEWKTLKKLPNNWKINYNDLVFNVKLMNFKHTGVFPEQAFNWNYLTKIISEEKRPIKVLNLFAYTGGATLACLKAHASVCHVDASKGMVDWAKENVISSNLQNESVRFIVDDVMKFVKREVRRGNKYDVIIMDPPSFGRGAKGEVWNIERDLAELVQICSTLLSNDPLLFLINSYTTGLSKTVLENLLKLFVSSKYKGDISSDELGINCKNNDLILPCGIYARWEKSN